MNNAKAFEAWVMNTSRRVGIHTRKDRNGKYLDNRVDAKWSAWQAALASQAQPTQEPYAYDVPTEDGTELAYAGYYGKYKNKLPEGAISLYLISQAQQDPTVCSDGGKCGAGGYCIACPNVLAPEGETK